MTSSHRRQSGEGSTNINSQPKFFKIIAYPHECSRLMFPQDFASRYCQNMQSPSYLEVPDGEVWEVEVVHSEGEFWLAKGLQEFSSYYSIYCGHFLMFRYNGRSHFKVIIFDLTATEIEYPYSAIHGTCRVPKREVTESDDMAEHSIENIGQCSLGTAKKRKGQEGDTEDDVSFGKHSKKSSKGGRKNKQQSMSFHHKDKRVMYKERAIAYQRAKAFTSTNPFIIRFMQPSYILSPFILSVSLKFVREYLLENSGDLVLRVRGRGSWSLKCSIGKTDARIFWRSFVRDNNLKLGDACVFEVTNRNKLLIDVTIFSAALDSKNKNLKHQRGGSYGFNSKIKEEHVECTEIEHSAYQRTFGKSKISRDKEGDFAYQRAKAFKSNNPFIISFIRPSYISKSYCLSIKLTFARKHFQETNSNLLLRVPGTGCWSVRCFLGRKEAKIRSGWKAFVLDNKLKVGDVCVFEVIKGIQPLLDVTIYRAAGSTSMHKIAEEVPGISYCKKKKVKQLREGSYGSTSKIKEEHDDGIETEQFEIQRRCALRHDSKRKRLVGEGQDDVSIDIHAKSIKVEKSPEDIASTSSTRKIKGRGETLQDAQKEQSKILYDKNKTVTMDKKKTIAYQRAKVFKSKNPFFISFMHLSYVSTPYFLSISSRFARKHYLDSCGDLVLRVLGRGFWFVKCTIVKSNAKILSGWKEFVLENKLKVGDVCVFEVIKGIQPLLDVTIFRAAGRTLMHKIAKDVPGVSYRKNKIVTIENSAPKVVQTKKLKQLRGGSYGSDSKIEEEDGEVEHFEIQRHCPLRHGSKRKGVEGVGQDDISIDSHAKSIKVEESQEDVASPFSARMTKERRKSGRMHKQQSDHDKNTTVKDKEKSKAYQSAKAFISENPFFVSFMQPSYIARPYILTIPTTFARKHCLDSCVDLVLRVPGRGCWSAKCITVIGKAKILSGWKAFVLDNNLKVGDVCVFEVIKGTQTLLDVTIFHGNN